MTAYCQHPRGMEDAHAPVCRTCSRARRISLKAKREQERLNEHRMSLGQRICAGLA